MGDFPEGLAPSYKKVIVRSNERTNPLNSTQKYSNLVTPGHLHKTMVSSVTLSDFSISPSQKIVEDGWSRMYVSEGFSFRNQDFITVGSHSSVQFMPSQIEITEIIQDAAVPVGFGGGTGTCLVGDFENINVGLMIGSLEHATGVTGIMYLQCVVNHDALFIPASEILGNTDTELYLSNGVNSAVESLTTVAAGTTPAAFLSSFKIDSPSIMAKFLNSVLSSLGEDSNSCTNFGMGWIEDTGSFIFKYIRPADAALAPLFSASDRIQNYLGLCGPRLPESRQTPIIGGKNVYVEILSHFSPLVYSGSTDITYSNYSSVDDVAAAAEAALNSNVIPPGLALNVTVGLHGGTPVLVSVPSGKFSTSDDFATLMQENLVAAGFPSAVVSPPAASAEDIQQGFSSGRNFHVTIEFETIHRIEFTPESANILGRSSLQSTGLSHSPTFGEERPPVVSMGLLNNYTVNSDFSGTRLVIQKSNRPIVPVAVNAVDGHVMTFSFNEAHGFQELTDVMMTFGAAGTMASGIVMSVLSPLEATICLGGTNAYTGTTGAMQNAAFIIGESDKFAIVTPCPPVTSRPYTYRPWVYPNCIRPRFLGLRNGWNASDESGILSCSFSVDLSASGCILVLLSINKEIAHGRMSHADTSSPKQLVRPLARICLDKGWVNTNEHDHLNSVFLPCPTPINSIGIELLNEDLTPYRTHGLHNSFSLLFKTLEGDNSV